MNSIYKRINPRLVEKYNNIKLNHSDALNNWLYDRYIPRTLLPNYIVDEFNKSDTDFKIFKYLSGSNSDNHELSVKQIKFIVDREDLIVNLHDTFNYYKQIDSTFNELEELYPVILNYYIGLHLNILVPSFDFEEYINDHDNEFWVDKVDLNLFDNSIKRDVISSVDELTIEQREIIVNKKDYFPDEQIRISNRITEIRNYKKKNFKRLILDDFQRNKYYISFLKSVGVNDKVYCLNNLSRLDSFIQTANLESEYEELEEKYPDIIDDYYNNYTFKSSDNSLQFQRYCVDRKHDIIRQNEINIQYENLYVKYSDGIKGYLDSNEKTDGGYTPHYKEKIINLGEDVLISLQNRSVEINKNNEWIRSQNKYSSVSNSIYYEYLSNWETAYSDIIFKVPSFKNEERQEYYRISQHFYIPYCSEDNLDYKNVPQYRSNYQELIPKIKKGYNFISNNEYDKIIKYICRLKEIFGDIYVVFANTNNEQFSDIHFEYLKKELSLREIDFTSQNITAIHYAFYKHLVIIELISTEQSLFKESAEIISDFIDISPNISYISFLKEISESEMIEIIDEINKKKEINSINEAEIEFLRSEEIRYQQEKIECQAQELLKQGVGNIKTQIVENPNNTVNQISKLIERTNNWLTLRYSSLKYFSMYYYYPTNCEFSVTDSEWDTRRLIWDFKANPNRPTPIDQILFSHRRAADKVISDMIFCLESFFDEDSLKNITLVCVPASKQEVTDRRFNYFSQTICKELNMINGSFNVKIESDYEPIHLGSRIQPKYLVRKNFFRGRNILLFDDVITSGRSMENLKRQLEHFGATVIAGFSIGKTAHERREFNPIDNIDMHINKSLSHDSNIDSLSF